MDEIYEDDIGGAMRDIAFDALATFTRIINVNTGRLRGATLVTIGSPSEVDVAGDTPGPFDSVGSVLSKGKVVIQRAKVGESIYIQNNVEYGAFVDERFLIVERTASETVKKFG